MKQHFLTVLFFISLTAGAQNLLPGDAGVETEPRNMTFGTWSAIIPGHRENTRYVWDSEQAFEGKRSIRIDRQLELSANEIWKPPAGQYVFSFYARAAKDGVKAFIGATPFHRSTWNTRLGNRKAITLTTEWKQYQYVFTADGSHSYVACYGLSEDGANAWFDAFQVEKGGKASAWVPPSVSVGLNLVEFTEANTFTVGEEVRFRASVRISDGKKRTLNISAIDYQGKEVFRQSEDVTGTEEILFSLDSGKRGWYGVTAQIEKDVSDYQSVVIVGKPVEIAPGQEPFAAAAASFDYFDAMKKLGVKWLETHVTWRYAEWTKGTYDFNFLLHFDRVIKAKEMGFYNKTLFSLWCPDWRQSDEIKEIAKQYKLELNRFLPPDDSFEDWRAMIRFFLNKNHRYVDLFELSGEEDAALGLNPYYKEKYSGDVVGAFVYGKPFADYRKFIGIAAEEILKVNPRARISPVRPSDVDARYNYAYSEQVLKTAGKFSNWFGIDCYPQPRWIGPGQRPTGRASDLKKKYEQTAAIMKKHAGGDNIYISEYGYFIDYRERHNPLYQREQANRLATSFLVARGIGMKSLFYYAIGHYASNLLEADRFWMGIYDRGMPFSAAAAYSAAAEAVENVVAVSEIAISPEMCAYVYKKADGSAVAALWSQSAEYQPGIKLEAAGIDLCDMMGNRTDKPDFILSEDPHYLWRRVPGADNYAELCNVVREAKILEELPVKLFFRHASRDQIKLYLTNTSANSPRKGVLEHPGGSLPLDVPPNATAEVFVPCAGLDKVPLTFNFAGGYEPYRMIYDMPEIHKIPQAGTLSLELKTHDRIMPIDHTAWFGADDLAVAVRMHHDAGYLYLTATVTDDRHFNNHTGENIWRGDCMQIGIDPKMNFIGREGLDTDDYIITVALDKNGKPEMVIHEGPNKQSLKKYSEYSVTRDEAKKQTVYRLKMPLRYIDRALKEKTVFGMSLVFFDDDSGAGADYWMFLSQGLAGERNPAKFALFELE